MPFSQKKIGVWEDGKFVGAVIYGLGAGRSTSGKKYGLSKKGDIAELVRVALAPNRKYPTSKVVARSIKMIKQSDPGLEMLVSFADEKTQGHLGTIYQATNWVYLGVFNEYNLFRIKGEIVHSRTAGAKWKNSLDYIRENVDPNAERVQSYKHRYAYPLTEKAKSILSEIAEPYPKKLQAQEV